MQDKAAQVLNELVEAVKSGDTRKAEAMRIAIRKSLVEMAAENRGLKVTKHKDGRWTLSGTWEQFEALMKALEE